MPRINHLVVNGTTYRVDVNAERTLLSVIRDDVRLTGTKYGCGEGQCGTCTVLVDGQPRKSCQIPVGSVASKQITTIEGLEKAGQLHPVQQAFIDAEAMQCGYCTPGMIMLAVALLAQNPNPSEDEIPRFMERNICRCGTYPRIVSAIRQAAGAAPRTARRSGHGFDDD
jgi:aerobic-type carbon monoxide dehydrogenase small subunit (CoxS/CutS family)